MDTQRISDETPAAPRLEALFDRLGIARAHLAARAGTDWQEFAARQPERIASLTLLCPQALDPAAAAQFGARVLIVSGDHGSGARRVGAVMPQLPQARFLRLDDYAGLTWADLAVERGAEIGAAMRDFLSSVEREAPLASATIGEAEGEIAGISYSVRGAGPPLVLLPLDLAPTQWAGLIPALSGDRCSITLGGPALGSIASLEERGRSDYMAILRQLIDRVAIRPGESVVEIGCGSGVVMRELARRTSGANKLTGIDRSPYLLGEAQKLAKRHGLAAQITFREGSAEALPLPDSSSDVALCCTVAEEGDADRMLAEIVRVLRPGGRAGIIVRAVDRGHWVNLPLSPELKAKVERPGMIGGGAAQGGCADDSLYARLAALGLIALQPFPQLVAVRPPSPRLERYQQQILAALDPAEIRAWHEAAAQATADGTFFIAQPFHCAVAKKPG